MSSTFSDFAALLTNSFYTKNKDSENVSSSVNSIGQTATGRFVLHKRHLYFSFYTSTFPLPTRPKSVQFVDSSGTILEEQQVSVRFCFVVVRGTEMKNYHGL